MNKIFPAGEYYIGDPCYAVANSKWKHLIKSTGCFGLENTCKNPAKNWWDGVFYYRKMKCFANGTRHGDGTYFDNFDRRYGVDAGLIGIIPASVCDGDYLEGGNIVKFENYFTVDSDKGLFIFGNVIIKTG
jgi:hypothetical protein